MFRSGDRGIRTPGRFNPTPVFKTGALSRTMRYLHMILLSCYSSIAHRRVCNILIGYFSYPIPHVLGLFPSTQGCDYET